MHSAGFKGITVQGRPPVGDDAVLLSGWWLPYAVAVRHVFSPRTVLRLSASCCSTFFDAVSAASAATPRRGATGERSPPTWGRRIAGC